MRSLFGDRASKTMLRIKRPGTRLSHLPMDHACWPLIRSTLKQLIVSSLENRETNTVALEYFAISLKYQDNRHALCGAKIHRVVRGEFGWQARRLTAA